MTLLSWEDLKQKHTGEEIQIITADRTITVKL